MCNPRKYLDHRIAIKINMKFDVNEMRLNSLLLLILVRLHDQSSSSDEVGGLLQVLQASI